MTTKRWFFRMTAIAVGTTIGVTFGMLIFAHLVPHFVA